MGQIAKDKGYIETIRLQSLFPDAQPASIKGFRFSIFLLLAVEGSQVDHRRYYVGRVQSICLLFDAQSSLIERHCFQEPALFQIHCR
jgi:hypothetical protein